MNVQTQRQNDPRLPNAEELSAPQELQGRHGVAHQTPSHADTIRSAPEKESLAPAMVPGRLPLQHLDLFQVSNCLDFGSSEAGARSSKIKWDLQVASCRGPDQNVDEERWKVGQKTSKTNMNFTDADPLGPVRK